MDEGVVESLVATATELDPRIRARVLRLANAALDQAEHIMLYGDPKAQSALIRNFLTILSRQLQVQNQNSEMEFLKSQLAELISEVRGYQTADNIKDVNNDAELDKPPTL